MHDFNMGGAKFFFPKQQINHMKSLFGGEKTEFGIDFF